ncbi:unnamed protein product, partial [Adineta steineri]
IDFKPQTQSQTTEKTTKKPKKSKRDADTPTPEDVCEELKDGQWPDPSDCKSYFLCRGVGSQWGEQKREVCYTGAYFDPNEKTCKWIGLDKLNCEELVEGYENPVAGVTRSSNKGDDDDDDTDDDDSPSDAGPTKSKKESKGSSSSKSISILSRTTSEFETCTQEKAVEFDPVQGMLCYSCDSQKENSDCQMNPNQTTSTMCETKQQICYSKRTTNAAGKLLQFSRGCSTPPPSTGNLTQQPQCLSSKAEGKTICVKYCQTSLCNIQDISDGAIAVSVSQITRVVYYLLALSIVVISTHHHC